MRRFFTACLLLFFTAIGSQLVFSPVQALDIHLPQPTSDFYLLDQAQFLSASAATTFINRSKAQADKSGEQIVAVILPTLDENSNLEEYATALFREWGIGDKKKNNGLLFLIIADSKKIRLEVGYGVEEYITDGIAGSIIRQIIAPAFKQGNYDQGLLQAQAEIIKLINGEESSVLTNDHQEETVGLGLSILAIIIISIIMTAIAILNNWWRPCPKCHSRRWKHSNKRVGGGTQSVFTCKVCHYRVYGSITYHSSSHSSDDWGGSSSGGSSGNSGGGGSSGGGGASGGW